MIIAKKLILPTLLTVFALYIIGTLLTIASLVNLPVKDTSTHTCNCSNNNYIKFMWTDTEASIPKDGSLIRIKYTDENTIYIGPIEPLKQRTKN